MAGEPADSPARRWRLVQGGVRTQWSPLPGGLDEEARALTEELRAMKDGTGLSLALLAVRTHYSRSSWERWLNGKRLITAQALLAFARVAEVADSDATRLLTLLDKAAARQSLVAARQPLAGAGPDAVPGAGLDARTPRPPEPAVAQLPAAIRHFTGRDAQVEALRTALANGLPGPGQVGVTVVSGGCGIGKTVLATHVAHQVADRFPDGSLYADLRGSAVGGAVAGPRDPADVLAEWLLALGDPAPATGISLDAQAARFRSLMRGRRFLLFLDDARDVSQVRPLLPAAETCAVLITSRRRLVMLAEASRLDLGPMPAAEAHALLSVIAGTERLAGDPAATAAIVEACAGVPLALRIAGARLSARPLETPRSLATRLADSRRALNALAIGDLSVRASLDSAYALLPAAGHPVSARHAICLLANLDSRDFSLAAAASALRASEAATERVLDALIDVHVLAELAPGRYRMPGLIRLYAADRRQDLS